MYRNNLNIVINPQIYSINFELNNRWIQSKNIKAIITQNRFS